MRTLFVWQLQLLGDEKERERERKHLERTRGKEAEENRPRYLALLECLAVCEARLKRMEELSAKLGVTQHAPSKAPSPSTGFVMVDPFRLDD